MTPGDNRIRVVVADDDELLLEGVVKMLTSEDGIDVVGTASDAEQAVTLAASTQPDVALTDVNMPLGGGMRATEGIRAASPQTHVVAHSVYEDRAAVMQMVRAGAIGYIVKGAPQQELVQVIRRAARGDASLSDSITSTVVNELATVLRQKEQSAQALRTHQAVFRRFISGDGMTVLFQPVFELAGGTCVGYEALARFDSQPERNPREWFDEAESVGFRLEMEIAAVKLALAGLDRLPAPLFLEVNASMTTLMAEAFEDLLDARVDGRLVIDVSACDRAGTQAGMHQRLKELRRRGIRVAVDDLGAPGCGIQRLLDLEPDLVKLDTAVVQAIGGPPSVRALARAIVGFARETGATVVGEGLEHPDDLEVLRTLGVAWVQGFLFGKPAPLATAGSDA